MGKPYKIKNVLDYRYRMIPTKEEYDNYLSNYLVGLTYDSIPPLTTEGKRVVYDALPRLDACSRTAGIYQQGLYDNKLHGWVIGSLNVDMPGAMAELLGIEYGKTSLYNLIGKLVAKRFSSFVMPSDYIYPQLSPQAGGSVMMYYNPQTSNEAKPTTVGWQIDTVQNTLTERFYLSIMKVVEPLYPKFVYEFSKYASVGDMFTGLASTVDEMSSNIQHLRENNHIDGSTLMHSANTPEVETNSTPEEVLGKYLSSVFKTKNNKEDNLTDAMKHFEEMVNHLVGIVAYTCFIPN